MSTEPKKEIVISSFEKAKAKRLQKIQSELQNLAGQNVVIYYSRPCHERLAIMKLVGKLKCTSANVYSVEVGEGYAHFEAKSVMTIGVSTFNQLPMINLAA